MFKFIECEIRDDYMYGYEFICRLYERYEY